MSAIHKHIETNLSGEHTRTDDEGSNVQCLFEEAAPFIQQLNIVAETESSTEIEDSGIALERLSILSDEIAKYPSDSMKEIALKVALYRAIAPESSQHQEPLTTDERLLGSIMSDIEKIS